MDKINLLSCRDELEGEAYKKAEVPGGSGSQGTIGCKVRFVLLRMA